MTKNQAKFELALLLAFEAGKWMGQVELEQHYDNEQYSSCLIESIYSKKNAMPLEKQSIGKSKQVTICLRFEEWRNGVSKSSNEYLEKAKKIFYDFEL